MLELKTDTGHVIKTISGRATRSISGKSGYVSIIVPTEYWNIILKSKLLRVYDSGALFNEYYLKSMIKLLAVGHLQVSGDDLTYNLKRHDSTKEWYVIEPGALIKDMVGSTYNVNGVEQDFLYNDTAGWTSTGAGTETSIVSGGAAWTNYGFRIAVKVTSGTDYSILCRYADSSNYYRLRFNTSGNALTAEFYKVVAGASTQIASRKILDNFDETQTHYISGALIDGTKMDFFLLYNDINYMLLRIEDTTFSTGTIGLRTDTSVVKFAPVQSMVANKYIYHYISKKSYFNVIRDMADSKYIMWNAPYDFYVESPNKLVFKKRGEKNSVVLKDGININDYQIGLEFDEIFNNIIVNVNSTETTMPWDGDQWTENNAADWKAWIRRTGGDTKIVLLNSVTNSGSGKMGAYYINIGGEIGSSNPRTNFGLYKFASALDLTKYGSMKYYYIMTGSGNGDAVELFLSSDECHLTTIGDGSGDQDFDGDGLKYWAMPFTAASNRISQICAKIQGNATSADRTGGSIFINLYNDSGGNPGSSIASITISDALNPNNWWGIKPDLAVTKGTQYWLVVRSTMTFSGGLHLGFGYTSGGSGMKYSSNGGSTWTNYTGGGYILYSHEPVNYFNVSNPYSTSWSSEQEKKLGTSGSFGVAGSPSWSSIKCMGIRYGSSSGTSFTTSTGLDGVHFVKITPGAQAVRSDSTSIAAYGQRDFPIDDAGITENQQAIDIAVAELKRRKEPPWRGFVHCQYFQSATPGQLIDIDIPNISLSGDLIILSKELFFDNTQDIILELGEYMLSFSETVAAYKSLTTESGTRVRSLQYTII